jgi:hypothetical protein
MRTLSEFEADIEALADRLRALPIGEIATYAELDQVLGRPVRAHRYLPVQARKRLEGNRRAVRLGLQGRDQAPARRGVCIGRAVSPWQHPPQGRPDLGAAGQRPREGERPAGRGRARARDVLL